MGGRFADAILRAKVTGGKRLPQVDKLADEILGSGVGELDIDDPVSVPASARTPRTRIRSDRTLTLSVSSIESERAISLHNPRFERVLFCNAGKEFVTLSRNPGKTVRYCLKTM